MIMRAKKKTKKTKIDTLQQLIVSMGAKSVEVAAQAAYDADNKEIAAAAFELDRYKDKTRESLRLVMAYMFDLNAANQHRTEEVKGEANRQLRRPAALTAIGHDVIEAIKNCQEALSLEQCPTELDPDVGKCILQGYNAAI